MSAAPDTAAGVPAPDPPALCVRGLGARAGEHTLLSGVDVDLAPGRVLAVLGASGSGKSTFGLALLGESGPGVALHGRVTVAEGDLLPARAAHPAAGRVAHVPQHPGSALDPVRRVGAVLGELAATAADAGAGPRSGWRGRTARRAAASRAVERALEAARLEPELARRFPHQLSGGQQQRVALALALVVAPEVVVLDEPTTGLDPVTTAEVVATLAGVARAGTALVVLTHDMAVARALADDTLVLDAGAPAGHALPYARADPAPASQDGDAPTAEPPPDRLAVSGLAVTAGRDTTLLAGVDLGAAAGSCLAVVGRSGAGKTSLARALAGLRPATAGRVRVDGRDLPVALRARDRDQRRLVQYVHQDPRASFLEHRPVRDQVARPAELLRGLDRATARAEADALLARLGLDEATRGRRPGALSGGQLQRAALARALTARPAVLVADEVTSALDARHRAELLDALDRVRRTEGTTVVLISHDLALVSRVAEHVAVLDAGRLVEHATVQALWSRPGSAAGRRLVDTARDPAAPRR